MPSSDKPFCLLLFCLISLATFSCKDDEHDLSANQHLLITHVEEGYTKSRMGEQDIAFDSWIFLSDQEGNMIGEPKQIKDNSILEWDRPEGFNAGSFYLNRFEYKKIQGSSSIYHLYNVYTFANFTLDEIYLLNAQEPAPPAPAGNVSVTVNNDFDGSKKYTYRLDFPSSSDALVSPENSISLSTTMQHSKEHGLLSFEHTNPKDLLKGREKYYFWQEFEAGEEQQVHTRDFTAMSSQQISIDFPIVQGDPYQQGQIFTWGHSEGRSTSIQTDQLWFSPSQSSLTAFYADELFPEVSSLYFFLQSHTTVIGLQTGKAVHLSKPEFSAKVIDDDIRNIKIRAKGNFDYLSASWDYVDNFAEEPSEFSRFLFTDNQESAHYVLPYIPQTLVDQYEILSMPIFYTRNIDATDYDAAHSYEDILKAWYSNKEQRPELFDFVSISSEINNEGGRLKGAEDSGGEKKLNPKSFLKPEL